MYQLPNYNIVIKDGRLGIPNSPLNSDRMEYEKWLAEGNIPLPADPIPEPEPPEPTISEVIDALEAKNLGDSTKWDAIRARKKALK